MRRQMPAKYPVGRVVWKNVLANQEHGAHSDWINSEAWNASLKTSELKTSLNSTKCTVPCPFGMLRLGSVLIIMEKSLFNLVPKNSRLPSNIHSTACTKRAKQSSHHEEVPKIGTLLWILSFEAKTLALWTKGEWTGFMPSCADLWSHNEACDCVWKPLCFCYRWAPWLLKPVVDACYVGHVFSVCFVICDE